jgi:hypothetical protein
LLKVHQSCKSKLGGHSNEIAKWRWKKLIGYF